MMKPGPMDPKAAALVAVLRGAPKGKPAPKAGACKCGGKCADCSGGSCGCASGGACSCAKGK